MDYVSAVEGFVSSCSDFCKRVPGFTVVKIFSEHMDERMWHVAQVLTAEELPEGKNKAIIHNNAGYTLSSSSPQFTPQIAVYLLR